MAVINATPDSFSADGLYRDGETNQKAIIHHLLQTLEAGADILDIGAESTRPGAEPISSDEQISRLQPVFSALKQLVEIRPSGWCVSLDTSDAAVAAWGLSQGVEIINDVRAGMSVSLLDIVAKYSAKIVLMHNSSHLSRVENLQHLGTTYQTATQHNIVEAVCDTLLQRVIIAQNAGIKAENILLDPGIGFGKSVVDNLRLIHATDQLKKLGYAVLVGASRKSFLGKILNVEHDGRVEASLMVHAHAMMQGADIIRAHDVAAHHRLRLIAEALLAPEKYHD